MKDEVRKYFDRLVVCLKLCGRYTEALDVTLEVLAAALYRHDQAVSDTIGLDQLTVPCPNGGLQLHPAYKVQIDTEEKILKYLKELGLTAEGTRERTERDNVSDMLGSMKEVLLGSAPVKPKTKASGRNRK